MVVLCDTSVLVSGVVKEHVHHSRTIPLIKRIIEGKLKGMISTHSLAESYASLTKIQMELPATPLQAREIIDTNIVGIFRVVELTIDDYQSAIERAAKRNLRSGAIYDSIIFQAAIKGKVSCLVTWNLKHFERLSQGEIQISTPESLA